MTDKQNETQSTIKKFREQQSENRRRFGGPVDNDPTTFEFTLREHAPDAYVLAVMRGRPHSETGEVFTAVRAYTEMPQFDEGETYIGWSANSGVTLGGANYSTHDMKVSRFIQNLHVQDLVHRNEDEFYGDSLKVYAMTHAKQKY